MLQAVDARIKSGHDEKGECGSRRLSCRVRDAAGVRDVDARMPGTSPDMSGHDLFISLNRRALTLFSFPSTAGAHSVRLATRYARGACAPSGPAARCLHGRHPVCCRENTPHHGAVHGAGGGRQAVRMQCADHHLVETSGPAPPRRPD